MKNLNMEAYVGEVGRRLETRGGGQDFLHEWWTERHIYKASLMMDKAMEIMEANDTLVVELTTEVQGGGVSVGKGGPTRADMPPKTFVIYDEQETWAEAEEVVLFS